MSRPRGRPRLIGSPKSPEGFSDLSEKAGAPVVSSLSPELEDAAIFNTSEEADLAAYVARASIASQQPEIRDGDDYTHRNPYSLPFFCDQGKAAFRLVAWRGSWQDECIRLCDPHNGNGGFPWTVCTTINMNDWCIDGMETDVVLNIARAVAVREQILLYMPRTRFNHWLARRAKRSIGKSGTAMGKNKDGFEPIRNVTFQYEEEEKATTHNGRTFAERSAVPEGTMGIGENVEV